MANNQPQQTPQPAQTPQQPKKGTNVALIIIIIVVFLLILGAGSGYYVYYRAKRQSKKQPKAFQPLQHPTQQKRKEHFLLRMLPAQILLMFPDIQTQSEQSITKVLKVHSSTLFTKQRQTQMTSSIITKNNCRKRVGS